MKVKTTLLILTPTFIPTLTPPGNFFTIHNVSGVSSKDPVHCLFITPGTLAGAASQDLASGT